MRDRLRASGPRDLPQPHRGREPPRGGAAAGAATAAGGDFDEVFALFPKLKTLLGRKGGVLSGGEQQQLAIARVLLARPKLLLMDEPTEGIQPNVILQIEDAIGRIKERGIAVLLVEQYLEFAWRLAGSYAIMRKGAIVASGGHRGPAPRRGPPAPDRIAGIRDDGPMHLTPREQDKLLVFVAAEVARRRRGPRAQAQLPRGAGADHRRDPGRHPRRALGLRPHGLRDHHPRPRRRHGGRARDARGGPGRGDLSRRHQAGDGAPPIRWTWARHSPSAGAQMAPALPQWRTFRWRGRDDSW